MAKEQKINKINLKIFYFHHSHNFLIIEMKFQIKILLIGKIN